MAAGVTRQKEDCATCRQLQVATVALENGQRVEQPKQQSKQANKQTNNKINMQRSSQTNFNNRTLPQIARRQNTKTFVLNKCVWHVARGMRQEAVAVAAA